MHFMQKAVELSLEMMRKGNGGPFGAVVVKNGKIISTGYNNVLNGNDPTAHAEIMAIREACEKLKTFQLTGCYLYTSCEPCPMCMGAIYWARPDKVFYSNSREEASKIGFDDAFIYNELKLPVHLRKLEMICLKHPQAIEAFEEWSNKQDKTTY